MMAWQAIKRLNLNRLPTPALSHVILFERVRGQLSVAIMQNILFKPTLTFSAKVDSLKKITVMVVAVFVVNSSKKEKKIPKHFEPVIITEMSEDDSGGAVHGTMVVNEQRHEKYFFFLTITQLVCNCVMWSICPPGSGYPYVMEAPPQDFVSGKQASKTNHCPTSAPSYPSAPHPAPPRPLHSSANAAAIPLHHH